MISWGMASFVTFILVVVGYIMRIIDLRHFIVVQLSSEKG